MAKKASMAKSAKASMAKMAKSSHSPKGRGVSKKASARRPHVAIPVRAAGKTAKKSVEPKDVTTLSAQKETP